MKPVIDWPCCKAMKCNNISIGREMNSVIKQNGTRLGKCELRAKRELKYSQSCSLLPLLLGFIIISCCSSTLNTLNNWLTKCRAICWSNYLYKILFIQQKDLGIVFHLTKSLWSFSCIHIHLATTKLNNLVLCLRYKSLNNLTCTWNASSSANPARMKFTYTKGTDLPGSIFLKCKECYEFPANKFRNFLQVQE